MSKCPNCGAVIVPAQSPLDAGPDFRVVPVRVLQSAHDRIDAMLANIDPDLRAANSVRIELRHLINETFVRPAVTSTDVCSGSQCSSVIPDDELAAWARNWHWNDCADDKPVDPSIYFRDARMLRAFVLKCRAALSSNDGGGK